MADHVERAQLLYHLNRDAQAITALHDALAEDPGRSAAYSWLALCQLRQGRQAEALAAAHDGVRYAPEAGWGYQVLATVLIRMGRQREALAAVDEALRRNPEWAPFHATRAWALNSLRRYREGLAAAEMGLRFNPRDASCGRMRGSALLNLGTSAAAEAALREALGWHPEDADLHQLLGWVLLRRGRLGDAAHHYRESLRLYPENSNAQIGLREADELLEMRRGGLNGLRVLGRRLARSYQPRQMSGAERTQDLRVGARGIGNGPVATVHLLRRLVGPFARAVLLPIPSRRRQMSGTQHASAWVAAVFMLTIVAGFVTGTLSQSADTGEGVWALASVALPVTVALTSVGRRRVTAACAALLAAALTLGLVLYSISETGTIGGIGLGMFMIGWLLSLASPWLLPAIARCIPAGVRVRAAGGDEARSSE